MKLILFIPELVLVLLIISLRAIEQSAFVLFMFGVLYGALAGAVWCSIETVLGNGKISKRKYAFYGVLGAAPIVVLYLLFGKDFFNASEYDWFFFRNRAATTQDERDIVFLATFGAALALLGFRTFEK